MHLLPIVGAACALQAQDVRPIRDDVGFCWDSVQMERLVSCLESREEVKPDRRLVVAGISPHDDYLYAGPVYYPLFRALKTKEVVIFGVTHGTVRKEIGDPQKIIILDEYPHWRGARGEVEVSPLRSYLKTLLPPEAFQTSNNAHRLEHSIEALVPFVQYFNPEIRITPIMVTAMPFEAMDSITDTLSALIAQYVQERHLALGTDIAFLISSDATHYGADFQNVPYGDDVRAHEKGTARDLQLARTYLTGTVSREGIDELTRQLWGKTYSEGTSALWCGRYSVPFGMLAIMKSVHRVTGSDLRGTLLRYSDTYTGGVLPITETGMGLTAPFSLKHWVGFFSVAYSLR